MIKAKRLRAGPYVLVIPGWYPTLQDLYTGDFNQRQVRAAGLTMPQVVLYITKDLTKRITKTETTFLQVTEKIIEITVIYPAKKNNLVDAVYSNGMFIKLLYEYATLIKKQFGKPLLIHSYIVIRGGLGGMLLARKWKLPFILSEHWTIYYPEDPVSLYNRNILFKAVVKRVFKKIDHFLPVTENLGRQVTTLFRHVLYTVVPNVVDTTAFNYEGRKNRSEPFRFIHVSTMAYQKNPEGLLRSFKKFNAVNSASCLWMVGPYPNNILAYARDLGLDEAQVYFTGSVSYNEVAGYIKNSNALVLFSRYENLPCVILESLCCGVPVISTRVGGVAEVINTENGVLVDNENEDQLTAAFNEMYVGYATYNAEAISAAATKLFSYEAVGQAIHSVYVNVAGA